MRLPDADLARFPHFHERLVVGLVVGLVVDLVVGLVVGLVVVVESEVWLDKLAYSEERFVTF